MPAPYSRAELRTMPILDLIVETLPKSTESHGDDYGELAKGYFQARLVTEAAAKYAAKAAAWTATGTIALFIATVALVVVELLSRR
ncbi:MAG: hypothetical protein ACRDWA_11875 [Acidimicrobiia bacterium]